MDESVYEPFLYHLSYFFLQEAIKKKLEIQKQKQELLNKQIKEQKVRIMNFIAAVCLTTYPPSHLFSPPGYFWDCLQPTFSLLELSSA